VAEEKIGIVKHFFTNINVAAIEIKNGELKIGDTIHIVGAHTDFKEIVDSMQIQNDSVEKVQPGDEVGIKLKDRVRENDVIYKIDGE
jgi:putative protease